MELLFKSHNWKSFIVFSCSNWNDVTNEFKINVSIVSLTFHKFDDSIEQNPQISYNHPFKGLVGLKITNDDGWSDINYNYVTIRETNNAPKIYDFLPLNLMCLICFALGFFRVNNSFLDALWKLWAPSLIRVSGLVPVTSLPIIYNGFTSAVYLVSATCWAIQNLVSSSIRAYRYFIFPFTFRYNSSVLQTPEVLVLIFF